MQSSDTTKNLYAALLKAQSEFPTIVRDTNNPAFNKPYATLESIVEATRPVLAENGLVVTQTPGGSHDEPFLTTVLAHDSGEALVEKTPLYLARRDSQGFGAAVTYARRYAYTSILGLTTEPDDDGNLNTAPPPPRPTAPRPQPQSTASAVASRAQAVRPPQPQGQPPRSQGQGGSIPATDGQKSNIRRLFMVTKNDHGWSREDWTAQIEFASDGRTRDDRELTKDEASTFISTVKDLIGEEDTRQQQAPPPAQQEFSEDDGGYGYSDEPF